MNSKKHPLRFAMAMERNLITVPCENEVRPEKEDALDWMIGGSRFVTFCVNSELPFFVKISELIKARWNVFA